MGTGYSSTDYADFTKLIFSEGTKGLTVKAANPKALFKTRMLSQTVNFHEFDVSPDGQRFVIGTVIGDTKAPSPTVSLNWTAELKK